MLGMQLQYSTISIYHAGLNTFCTKRQFHNNPQHSCFNKNDLILQSAFMSFNRKFYMHMNAYAYQYMCIHFVHACAPLMSPGTTCDLGKGKVSVLMWQLMPFPPLQMVLIGHGTAQGQLLGVTVTERQRARGERVRRRQRQGCI